MNKIFLALLVATAVVNQSRAACSSCGGSVSAGTDSGPVFSLSVGQTDFGQSAGTLNFGGSQPGARLFTPVALDYSGMALTNVTTLTQDLAMFISWKTNVAASIALTTNTLIYTNIWFSTNTVGTNVIVTTNIFASTNLLYDTAPVFVTNITANMATNSVIRQIFAPQVLVDVLAATNQQGFTIGFYQTNQVTGVNMDGTFQLSGSPFAFWVVTNTTPPGVNQLQISQFMPVTTLLHQWTYTYSTNTGTWAMGTLAGIQKTMTVTNLGINSYQVIDTLQYSNGPVARQTITTYSNFTWGTVAPIEVDVGSGGDVQRTTYTYTDPSTYSGNGNRSLLYQVTHPDGSREEYDNYDTNGLPQKIYSTFQNDLSGREVDYDYTAASLSGSGDDGSLNPTVARQVIEYTEGTETARRYTVFPSVSVRLDIQCTDPGAGWNDAGNLVTTNIFFTSGPNQFALQKVLRPDGTATIFNYITNGYYQTNVTVTGQPDPTDSYIVDGVSNVVVINSWGYRVSSTAWDVKNTLALRQDTYGNYDSYGRPQSVSHLDGTVETNVYACCGLDHTIDRDGLTTIYLYDTDKRQYGNQIVPVTPSQCKIRSMLPAMR
jgi:hypothetical protein